MLIPVVADEIHSILCRFAHFPIASMGTTDFSVAIVPVALGAMGTQLSALTCRPADASHPFNLIDRIRKAKHTANSNEFRINLIKLEVEE